MTLVSGASGGGTDIVGVYAALHWKSFSVGKLQLLFNALVYCLCAFLFDLPIAIYSIIYAAVYSFVLDKVHLQNIEMSLMIFTKNPEIKKPDPQGFCARSDVLEGFRRVHPDGNRGAGHNRVQGRGQRPAADDYADGSQSFSSSLTRACRSRATS